MKRMTLAPISSLALGQKFADPKSGLTYTVAAIAGPDHIIADADKGQDMFYPIDYRVAVSPVA